jgi:hypothetical protein
MVRLSESGDVREDGHGEPEYGRPVDGGDGRARNLPLSVMFALARGVGFLLLFPLLFSSKKI